MMAVHGTAMAWFARILAGPFFLAGGFHGNPRLCTIDCGNRDRCPRIRCFDSSKCSLHVRIGIMTVSWMPTNWPPLYMRWRDRKRISASNLFAGVPPTFGDRRQKNGASNAAPFMTQLSHRRANSSASVYLFRPGPPPFCRASSGAWAKARISPLWQRQSAARPRSTTRAPNCRRMPSTRSPGE